MTYKHIKFQDSTVMRSLERLAQEKGLVKQEEEFTKIASETINLDPSLNLTENILNLCAGLKQIGLNKFASELEDYFLNYKRAQTLYETSKETGDDLINDAHPDGSHKLEDVDGGDLAVIETILDQHLKNLKIVNKTPTGKLSEASEILKTVKRILE